ncbi:MAG: type II secretion system F family protein [Armatimonadota bacterium]|nr:type II secretion system F family protein [bacterium]
MALYSYKVKDSAGRTRTGTLEAENERQAAAMIREAGGFPMDIRLASGAQPQTSDGSAGSPVARYLIHPFWTGVSLRGLMFFFRQLATMLAAGMSLSEALRNISERMHGSLGRIVRAAHARVQSGGKLSDEMIRHPRVFAPLQVSLIRAGEQSGLLEPMADRIASHIEFEINIRRRIITATLYPMLILLFMFLFPALIALVTDGVQAAAWIVWGQFQMFGIPILIILIVCKFLFQFNQVRLVWDVVKIQPPVLGTMARKIAMSRFSRSLALMYSSGVPIGQSVSISADACANIAISRSIKRVIPAINDGQPLTESLQKTGMMLPVVLDMLDVGEKTGGYDVTLQKVAEYMDDEVNTTLRKLPIVLFVLMMLLAGVLAGIQIIAGYIGYVNQITKMGAP